MNTYMLKGKIRECRMTQGKVAAAIGISAETFSMKINENGAVFNLNEMRAIRSLLGLTDEDIILIFFS